MSVGGGLGGIIGMMVAVPITATLYGLAQEWVHKRNAKKELEKRKQNSMEKTENRTDKPKN